MTPRIPRIPQPRRPLGEDDKKRLEWFVIDAPLYHVVKLPVTWPADTPASEILPDVVNMPCEDCPVDSTNWDRTQGGYAVAGETATAIYTCRNCKAAHVQIFYRWKYEGGWTHFEKCGRDPKFEIRPSKELAHTIGKHLDLYRKGMTCRHHGFGLGALVYFRRIVEETTGELLDLLEAAVQEAGGDAAALKTISEAKAKRAFDDKVKVAASALPSHIRLGGVNPLDLLHDLLSDGIHARIDAEAIETVDGIDRVLEYLFTELKAHTAKRKGYAEAVKQLMARRKEAKKEPS